MKKEYRYLVPANSDLINFKVTKVTLITYYNGFASVVVRRSMGG